MNPIYWNRILLTTIISAFTFIYNGSAQQSISLSECIIKAEQNYPLIKQNDLIALSEQYNLSNLERGIWPQISLNGQGTWQSEVMSFRLPGVNIVPPGKDQYKIYAEVNQPLTELHTVKTQKQFQQAQAQIQQHSLQSEIYKIRERIQQIYFGILLSVRQEEANRLNRIDIETGISKVTAAINNGVDYKTSLDKLKAELVRNEQRSIELASQKKAYTEMLAYFINQSISNDVKFTIPETPLPTEHISRFELRTFEAKEKSFTLQEKIIKNKNLPKFSLFMQGGAGQPSPLNFIMRDMRPFFIGGLRFNWSFNNLFTQKNELSIIGLDKKNNDLQKSLFLFNTQLIMKQQNNEVIKLYQLLQTDEELVSLRNSIKNTAAVQLENGIITSGDYIKETNAEDLARQNKTLHEIQLLMAQYNLQFITGNENH